jgi:hypothetical protein
LLHRERVVLRFGRLSYLGGALSLPSGMRPPRPALARIQAAIALVVLRAAAKLHLMPTSRTDRRLLSRRKAR